jgi:hypothetical protein
MEAIPIDIVQRDRRDTAVGNKRTATVTSWEDAADGDEASCHEPWCRFNAAWSHGLRVSLPFGRPTFQIIEIDVVKTHTPQLYAAQAREMCTHITAIVSADRRIEPRQGLK